MTHGSDSHLASEASWAQRWAPRVWVLVALVGLGYGLATLQLHLRTDAFADVHAYYDAATRLNAGQPLYPAGSDTNAAEFYRYPPLLALAFRPIAAVLSFEAAAVLWAAFCFACFVATLVRLGIGRPEVWIAAGVLGMPIAWALAIGQAQVPVTLLLAVGSPWAIALAANLKLLPALVAVYWLGRREWRSLALFIGWSLILLLAQFLLEPAGTIAFFGITNLSQVGEIRNLSPYAVSPLLWIVLVAVLTVAALRLAPTRAGWGAAVALSVLATPRLLAYMFVTFVSALRRERPAA